MSLKETLQGVGGNKNSHFLDCTSPLPPPTPHPLHKHTHALALQHRFTHRVARGVLLAAGRPDGRICSQTAPESWVLLALTQAHLIAHKGNQPEILTVGHNPFKSKVGGPWGKGPALG
jgi:hypothetical protein